MRKQAVCLGVCLALSLLVGVAGAQVDTWTVQWQDSGDWTPTQINTGSLAQSFTATAPFLGVGLQSPNWNGSGSSYRMRLFTWNTDYATSEAGVPIKEEVKPYEDNAWVYMELDYTMPAGDYLLVTDQGQFTEGETGHWGWNNSTAAAVPIPNAYRNGEPIDGLVFQLAIGTGPDPGPAAETNPLISDDDLVVYYSFENVGTTVADGSGNGYDGAVNGTIVSVDGGKRGRMGQISQGAFLDMNGAGIAAGDIPTSGFTLAAWANVHNTGGQHAIFNARSSDDTFLIHPEIRTGDYRLTLRGNGSTKIGDINAGTPVWNEWIHYVATYDQGAAAMTLYINGQVVGSLDAGGLENVIPMASDWANGARLGYNVDDARPFSGLMDEFYIFKRALSAAEVTNLYNLQEPAPIEPIVMRFDCDVEGWVPQNNLAIQHVIQGNNGLMAISPTGADPHAQVPVAVPGASLPEFAALIYVENMPDGITEMPMSLYFWTPAGPGRAGVQNLVAGVNVVRVNVPASQDLNAGTVAWDDTVHTIRLDLPEGDPAPYIAAGTVVLVDAIAISDDPAYEPAEWTINMDCDMDGLSNAQEEALGTDPTLADTDGDGVADGVEVQYGSNPLDGGDTVTVPAMTYAGIALMALLLAAAAAVLVRRRSMVS